MVYLEAKNLSEVADAKSRLEAGDGAAGGSAEVSVDSVQVNTLGNHGEGLTNDLDDVVQAKGIGSVGTNAVNKADELVSQGGGVRKCRLDLEINCLASWYHKRESTPSCVYLLDDGAEKRDELGLDGSNVDDGALDDTVEEAADITN